MNIRRGLIRLAAALMVAAGPAAAASKIIIGPAHVVDGDTLEVAGQSIRLVAAGKASVTSRSPMPRARA